MKEEGRTVLVLQKGVAGLVTRTRVAVKLRPPSFVMMRTIIRDEKSAMLWWHLRLKPYKTPTDTRLDARRSTDRKSELRNSLASFRYRRQIARVLKFTWQAVKR